MDDYSNLIELVKTNPEAALIPVGLAVGKFVKSTQLNNKYIPYVVVLVTMLISFLIAGMNVDAVIKGFIAGIGAVGLHSSFKAVTDDKSDVVAQTTTVTKQTTVEKTDDPDTK